MLMVVGFERLDKTWASGSFCCSSLPQKKRLLSERLVMDGIIYVSKSDVDQTTCDGSASHTFMYRKEKDYDGPFFHLLFWYAFCLFYPFFFSNAEADGRHLTFFVLSFVVF